MLKVLIASLALFVSAVPLAQEAYARPGGGSSARSEVRLEARMRSGRTEAKVAWRSDRGRLKVQAEVYRAKPNTKYAVTHKGTTIASITTDKLGNGRYENERARITMAVGDAVGVGPMNGKLATKR